MKYILPIVMLVLVSCSSEPDAASEEELNQLKVDEQQIDEMVNNLEVLEAEEQELDSLMDLL